MFENHYYIMNALKCPQSDSTQYWFISTVCFTQTVLLYHHKKLTVMLAFILNLLILDGMFALFGALCRGPGIINQDFFEVRVYKLKFR